MVKNMLFQLYTKMLWQSVKIIVCDNFQTPNISEHKIPTALIKSILVSAW